MLAILSAAGIGLLLVLLLIRGACATPFSDEFYFYKLYASAQQGAIDFNEIFRPHFGHVYVLLKSWLWLVVHYKLDWRVSMYLQAGFIALTALLLSRYSMPRIAPKLRVYVAVAIALALGSPRQFENLYMAMQVSAAVMVFFACAAFYAVAKYSETEKDRYAMLAIACAFLSFISTGGGLMAFVLVLASLLLIAKTNKLRIVIVAAGAAFLLIVASYMRSALEAGPMPSLLNAKNFLIYFPAFFANALYCFTERGDDVRSICFGVAILAGAAYAVQATWQEKEKHVLGYLLIGFGLASCLAIAYARLKSGIWQPNAPRYYPSAVTLVIGALLLFARKQNKDHSRLALLIVVLIVVSFSKSYRKEWRSAPDRYAYFNSSHANLCSGKDEGLAFMGNVKTDSDLKVLRDVFCTDEQKRMLESQPVLLEIGPTQTSKGMSFNQQPDGQSALWARTEHCEHSCTLVFADVELPVLANATGTVVTTNVPPELYNSSGEKVVYIKNTRSNKKSRTVVFQVN